MRSERCGVFVALMLAVAAVVPAATRAAAPAIYNLGTLGGSASQGYAINASGQVTGVSYPTGSTVWHAFLYSGTPGSGGAMANLGTLGGSSSYSFAINDGRQVVGYSDISGNTEYHAFIYGGTPGSGGSMADLGTLGGAYSAAYAINAGGQVAGWGLTTGSAQHAFLYSGTPGSGGHMIDLGTLGGSGSSATAINSSGQLTGSSDVITGSISYAFLYTGTPGAGGHMVGLGTLGGSHSYGTAINANGQVAGYSYRAGDLVTHAFLYSGTPGSGGAMADLGTLGGSTDHSYGYAIDSGGRVVGSSGTRDPLPAGGFASHAFLYSGTPSAGGQMIDLDDWLDANNPTEGAKWTLTDALALTDTGLITGVGDYNDGPGGLSDGRRAFLLDASALVVPEPAGFVLLGIGVVGLLCWRAPRNRLARALPWRS